MKISFTAICRILINEGYIFVIEKSEYFKEKDVWVLILPQGFKVEGPNIMLGNGIEVDTIKQAWSKYKLMDKGEPLLWYDIEQGCIIGSAHKVMQLIKNTKTQVLRRIWEPNIEIREKSIFDNLQNDVEIEAMV